MEFLIGGIFLAVFAFGFILWLGGAISAAQTQGQPAPAPARQKSEYGNARMVRSTPRQRETAAKVKASDRAIATERRKAVKGLPKGTVHYERIKPVSYEGKTVNAICLNDQGEITGYVALDEMPLEWE